MLHARQIPALLTTLLLATAFPVAQGTAPAVSPGLEYIGTGFEHASPMWYDIAEDGAVRINLLYDHERQSPNRAAGHIHFLIHARSGSKHTFEFRNLDNVWNGQPGSVAAEL